MRKLSSVLTPALFVGSMLFVGTALVRADDDCRKRISNADHKLHEAIEHHGPENYRPSTGAMNSRNHVTTVMSTCTAGGTKTHIAGARIATGMTTIMTMTAIMTIPITSFSA